ncbi:unnamed protein product [Rotaria sordida]|uniref:Uncharacterized protein n=1 Tax=Rotaria sordida TaxID=392033 RepID=A0A815G6P1_9BILA|nr:unnamed protein product [Rotaria sordida]
MAETVGNYVPLLELSDVYQANLTPSNTSNTNPSNSSSVLVNQNQNLSSSTTAQSINLDLESIPTVAAEQSGGLPTYGIIIIIATVVIVATAAISAPVIYFSLKVHFSCNAIPIIGGGEITTTILTTTDTTSTSTTDTTSTTETTTTPPCPTGYVRTPSGSCVNLLIDFNNCGSIGYVCASTYTSCSNGACSGAPAVQLTGAVAVPGWGGAYSVDDASLPLSLPFSISLYGYSTSTASVQSNGCVCLGSCSNSWSNSALPSGSFSDPTAFGLWDDLYIYAGTSQTVYYATTGTSPNRTLVFEFYTAHYSSSTRYFHFQIIFYEASLDIVSYSYFQVSDGGASATIGVQSSASGPSITYSVDSVTLPYGASTTSIPTLTLTFDTNAGTYTSSG